jgi:tyrosinase
LIQSSTLFPLSLRVTNRCCVQGNFLTWHRYFTWAYEQALRNECGYKGYQPYWSWPKYADDPLNSPIFDGSEYSMSGDGSYIPHDGPEAAPGIILEPGHGGGCVTSGPFKKYAPLLLHYNHQTSM